MINIKELTMRYGAFAALDGVSFDVNRGEILGLLGPNGAGKTTLMRVLTTYLYPSAGTATVAGFDIREQPLDVRRSIGYLPETAPLYPEMRVDEYLRFVGTARELSTDCLQERLAWVQQACEVKQVWKHLTSELSKGFRQRVGLAQALIHDPEVLILDEPTSGLDPLQILGIRRLIRELATTKTIIFSTHILQEVEALADRIVIINDGGIVADGTREELTKRALGVQRVRVTLAAPREEAEPALAALEICERVEYEGRQGTDRHRFLVQAKPGHPVLPMLDALIKERGWPVVELAEVGTSLEQAFIALLRPDRSETGVTP